MSPEVVSLLRDAIQILGGACVGGWFAYRAGKVQLDAKLKELAAQNSFRALEHLFAYYEDRRKQLIESSRQLGEVIGTLAAELGGTNETDSTNAPEGADFQFTRSLVSTLSTVVSIEVADAKSTLRSQGLSGTEYERKIDEFAEKANWTTIGKSRQELLDRALLLFEVYSLLAGVRNMLLERKAEELLSSRLG